MSDNRELNNILLRLSQLHSLSVPIETREDGILQTPVGCFRVAYSPSTHTSALFYARHPDDLAATDDVTGPTGIAHKERLILIKMYKVHHDPDATWDPKDQRQQFDMTWLRREIPRIVHDLPRVQFREANLHRASQDIMGSAFVAYKMHESDRTPQEFGVDIITKNNEHFRLPTFHTPEATVESHSDKQRPFLLRLFRALGRQMVKRRLSATFPLRTIDPVNGEKHTSFRNETVRDAIETDFAIRLKQIERGIDVAHWAEAPLLPIYRGGTALVKSISELKDARGEDLEKLIRKSITLGVHLVLDGGLAVLGATLIDKAGEFATKENLGDLPSEWQKIADRSDRRLVSIESNLHKLMIRPDPKHFGDLRWLNPDTQISNYATPPNQTIPVDREHIFRRWLTSLFLSPYASSFEYRGDNYELLPLARAADFRVTQMQTSSGVVMYYTHETGKLYAHFNQPDYLAFERKLPADSTDFFKAGQVLEIDLKNPDTKLVTLPFDQFQNEIRRLSGAPELQLPQADTPSVDSLNPRTASALRTTSLPKSEPGAATPA